VTRQAAALLMSLRGSICIYQGEELGQTETELEWHELTDPEGKEFWPVIKGRDGCRTPMVWDRTAQGGFTTGTPWLPVKPPQLANAASEQAGVEGSVLEYYRRMLAFRRATPQLVGGPLRFVEAAEPVLAFMRDDLLCVFNLSSTGAQVRTGCIAEIVGPVGGRLDGDALTLDPNGWAFLRIDGDPVISKA
jgi:alpha-glucosidase